MFPIVSTYRIDMSVLDVQVRDAIATVVLHREKVNAINPTVVEELSAAFAQLQRDSDIRAVVLTGHGKCFSSASTFRNSCPIRASTDRTDPPRSPASSRCFVRRSPSRWRGARQPPLPKWSTFGTRNRPGRICAASRFARPRLGERANTTLHGGIRSAPLTLSA